MVKLDTIWTRISEMSKKRLEICKECEYYTQSTSKCAKCGCFMKAKALLKNSECPIEKWNKYDESC